MILLSTLPISAGATILSKNYIDVRFKVEKLTAYSSAQNAALDELYFYNPDTLKTVNVIDAYDTVQTLNEMTYDDDNDYFDGQMGIFYNYSPYDIYVSLAYDNWKYYTTFVVPGGSEKAPGVYELGASGPSGTFFNGVDTSQNEMYIYVSDVEPPVLNSQFVNEGCVTFYAKLPHGENVPLGTVRPPEGHTGSYQFVYSKVMGSFQLDDWQLAALEGYEINSALFDVGQTFIIQDDEIYEIFIPYIVNESSARTIRFELYDENYNFIKVETVKVSNTATTCSTPLYGDCDTFPYVVDIDLSKPNSEVQVFKCYVFNVLEKMLDSYDKGYKDGFSLGQAAGSGDGESWQEGYDQGLKDGLSQNSLTAEQIQHYTKDYNAITAFFDGLFGWMKDMFFDVGEGIQYKGVKAIDIVSSVVIIAVVIWGYKVIF